MCTYNTHLLFNAYIYILFIKYRECIKYKISACTKRPKLDSLAMDFLFITLTTAISYNICISFHSKQEALLYPCGKMRSVLKTFR